VCGLEVVLIVYDLLECFYTSSSDAKSWFPLFSMLSSRPHWQSFAGESYSFSEREHYWIDTSGVFYYYYGILDLIYRETTGRHFCSCSMY